jgi:hypothetical protein
VYFSENQSYISLSPAIGRNIFSLAFGHILDAHNMAAGAARVRTRQLQCFEGCTCYMP